MIVKIGALKLKIASKNGQELPVLPSIYRNFKKRCRPDVVLYLNKSSKSPPAFREANKFKSGVLNIYWFRNGKYYFTFKGIKGFGYMDLSRERYSFTAPNFSAVVLNLIVETVYNFILDQKGYEGIMFHACGVINKSKGYLFAAPSGGGKSTIGRITVASKKKLLNDDRIIVDRIKKTPMIFGCPWHGDVSHVSSVGARLEKIFFLKKGKSHTLKLLDQKTAAIRMMSNIFFLPLNPKSKEIVLGKCLELAYKIPSYELTFYPNKNIWRYIGDN